MAERAKSAGNPLPLTTQVLNIGRVKALAEMPVKAALSSKGIHMAAKQENQGDLREKLVQINRVAKVIKGGRIFGFTALTVVGDGEAKLASVVVRRVKCR